MISANSTFFSGLKEWQTMRTVSPGRQPLRSLTSRSTFSDDARSASGYSS